MTVNHNTVHDAPKLSRRKQNKQAREYIANFLENRRRDIFREVIRKKYDIKNRADELKALKAELAEVNRLIDTHRTHSK